MQTSATSTRKVQGTQTSEEIFLRFTSIWESLRLEPSDEKIEFTKEIRPWGSFSNIPRLLSDEEREIMLEEEGTEGKQVVYLPKNDDLVEASLKETHNETLQVFKMPFANRLKVFDKNDVIISLAPSEDNINCIEAMQIKGSFRKVPILSLEMMIGKLACLRILKLVQCKLTDESLHKIADFLKISTSITDLCLDANPIKEQSYYLVLKDAQRLRRLSLRFCEIDDTGIRKISNELMCTDDQTNSLEILNLNSNQITCEGMSHLARALRWNRTLLSISLASNQIKDNGCKALSASLVKFILTPTERDFVDSRKLKMFIELKPIVADLYELAKGDSRVRGEGQEGEEEEEDKGSSANTLLKKSNASTNTYNKEHESLVEEERTESSVLTSLISEDSFITSLKGIENSHKIPIFPPGLVEDKLYIELWSEMYQEHKKNDHIALRDSFYEDGDMYCPGNDHLLYINLAYNQIEDDGVTYLHNVILYQKQRKRPGRGLTMIDLEGNLAQSSLMKRLESELRSDEIINKIASDQNIPDLPNDNEVFRI